MPASQLIMEEEFGVLDGDWEKALGRPVEAHQGGQCARDKECRGPIKGRVNSGTDDAFHQSTRERLARAKTHD